ncbi:hypothetical protein ARMGADRAFT_227818 [Armillaria gallica]|uniref:Uncharacterized protein n=1 Tax=Armillaria gallica TaxID=47427 RepID=A0A2H3EFL7_ARMGA|nr:hypothetical protein ARMGADRAFT_227818 [Armillaria gallica]
MPIFSRSMPLFARYSAHSRIADRSHIRRRRRRPFVPHSAISTSLGEDGNHLYRDGLSVPGNRVQPYSSSSIGIGLPSICTLCSLVSTRMEELCLADEFASDDNSHGTRVQFHTFEGSFRLIGYQRTPDLCLALANTAHSIFIYPGMSIFTMISRPYASAGLHSIIGQSS